MDSRQKLNWCPIHHIEDTCYSDKLESKWNELKQVHAQTCKIGGCGVSDKYKTITHGNCGVSVNVEFWWREMRYI